jgi:inorganic pyrophosphatase
MDYNKILTPGDLPTFINVVIEIPQGSTLKVEYRRELGIFEIDRNEPTIFAKPTNYGFIPATLDEDGDELDVLLISDEVISTGIVTKARVIGVMNFDDGGEMDHKIIAVIYDDKSKDHIKTHKDLGEQWEKKIEHHFTHYKDLKKGGTKVLGFSGIEEAYKIVEDCIARWNTK